MGSCWSVPTLQRRAHPRIILPISWKVRHWKCSSVMYRSQGSTEKYRPFPKPRDQQVHIRPALLGVLGFASRDSTQITASRVQLYLFLELRYILLFGLTISKENGAQQYSIKRKGGINNNTSVVGLTHRRVSRRRTAKCRRPRHGQ